MNMADSTLSQNNPKLRCWICKDLLVLDFNRDIKVVTSECGHVLHEKCLTDWYNVRKTYECPVCKNTTLELSSINLVFDMEDNDFQALEEEIKRLNIANCEQKKQLTVAEIRLITLGNNKAQLKEKFSTLKWEELTSPYQVEMIRKLQMSLTDLDIGNIDLSFLSSKFIIKLIGTSLPDASLLPKFVKEYYEHVKLESNVTLRTFVHIFKNNITAKLREKCGIPDLDTGNVPVSPNILLFLLDESRHDKNMFTKIVEMYLLQIPKNRISYLCRVVMLKLMSEEFNDEIRVQAPFLTGQVLSDLVQDGILRRDNGFYDFSNDYIKFYITGMILTVVMQAFNMNEKSARHLFFGGTSSLHSVQEYFIGYFKYIRDSNYEVGSHDTLTLMQTFVLNEENNADTLAVLAVMKICNANQLAKVFSHFETYFNRIGKNVWEISYECILVPSYTSITLPQFAAIRGDLDVMQKLYSMYVMADRAKMFDVQKLVHSHASETLCISEEAISKRKDFLSFILSLHGSNGSMTTDHPTAIPRTVHFSLLKFVMEHGHETFESIWNVWGMIIQVRPFVTDDQFMFLANCVFQKTNLIKMLQIYCSARPVPL